MPISKLASLAVTAALTGLQMGLNALRKIEGPRLEDLSVSVADYGTPLTYFYGTRRLVPQIIFSEEIREEKKKRKTKGGKYNDYTYFWTGAFVIADHEIDGVTRLWMDKHLVLDRTGTGPISPFSLGKKANIEQILRFYMGTDTQEADPRMLATIEGLHGAGSCPAYRRIALGMAEELPLEKVGNRVPQLMVEAVANGTAGFPYEEVDTLIAITEPVRMSPDGSRFMFHAGGQYEIWDTASRRRIIKGSWSGGGSGRAISNDGRIWGLRSASGPDGKILTVRDPDGFTAASDVHTFTTGTGFEDMVIVHSLTDEAEIAGMYPFSSSEDVGWYFIKGFGGR